MRDNYDQTSNDVRCISIIANTAGYCWLVPIYGDMVWVIGIILCYILFMCVGGGVSVFYFRV